MSGLVRFLRRLQIWLPRRWHTGWPLRAGRLPPPGTAQAAARCGAWALAWASHTGPHHLNQDCAGATWRHAGEGGGLAVAVADGVTNGAAGDVAALALVQHWLQGPKPPQRQRTFLGAAETAVVTALRQLTPEPGAATGAACWLGPDGSGWATRVGDCRLLHVAPPLAGLAMRWSAQPLLPDQTYANLGQVGQDWQPSGLEAEQPARMVGVGSLGEPERVALTLVGGELLLLVSDGLHSVLTNDDWHAVLSHHLGSVPNPVMAAAQPQSTLLALADHLIQTAIQRGSDDDITVLAVMRCAAHPSQKEPPS